MKQNRTVRKYGDTWIIRLTPTDAKDRELDENKDYEADISGVVIKEVKNEQRNNKR